MRIVDWSRALALVDVKNLHGAEQVEVIFSGEPGAACLRVCCHTPNTSPLVLGQRTLAIPDGSDITEDKLLWTRRL